MNGEVKFLREFKKNIYIFFFFLGGGSGPGGGGGWGVRVDVNREVKFFMKIQKKKFWGVGLGGRVGGSGWM